MLKLRSLLMCAVLVVTGAVISQAYAGDNASFVSQSASATMYTGQSYTVSVTMKNNGTTTWTAAKNYRLGSQNAANNTRWGLNRVYLSSTESIAPGRSKTFTFTVKAPATAGTYNFQWRMLREGVAWFGAYTTNLKIIVKQANRAPVLTPIGNKSVNENQQLTFTVSATDPDGNALTYSATGLPSGATFNTSTRVFSWTPTYTQSGTYSNVKFTVSDGSLTASESISITVNNVNRAPDLAAIGNKSVNENQALTFTVSATDPDGNALTYSASNIPSGATFNASTGQFSWTPTYEQAGIYQNITFTVSDGTLTDSEAITITVVDVPNGVTYSVIVDDHDTAMPTEGQYYNYTGGDRGMLNANYMTYSRDGDTSYKATLTSISGLWQWGGMWYSFLRDIHDNVPLDFKAIFGPYVKSEYQGEITEVQITVKSVSSPTNNTSLKLRIELKDATENLIGSKEFTSLAAGTYSWVLPEGYKGKIKTLLWILDYAKVGDSISIDKVVLKAKVPDLTKVPSQEQAFLWTFSWLMNNYDSSTGMVQDRSGFELGDFENVSATGKTAKVVYYAYKKGYITYDTAKTIITKIADTLIYKLPRGPSGVNSLWPHFTRNGGTEAMPPHVDENGASWAGSEWASGDTSYAALDVIAALQMLGDPSGQIILLENYLKSINWAALLSGGYISFGYLYEGTLIPYSWSSFGMEAMGVNWAYASSTGNQVSMPAPPTYNGSGFIDNAQYPMVFSGTDQWGNDWDAYRSSMADTQINWYTASDRNSYLKNSGLFGLSAAETPEADGGYEAYGVGGTIAANDGSSEVFVLHYPGMISDIRLQQAKQMWESLRDASLPVLSGKIVISPLNNMESIRVNKSTGKTTINHLKGSWNMALQAEGWALADAAVRADLASAIQNNAFLKSGYDILKNGPPAPTVLWEESAVPVASPVVANEINTLNDNLFVKTSSSATTGYIYKSSDLGANWQQVSTGLSTGTLYSMDVDQGNLYISSRNGIAVSSNQGSSFSWSFSWTWDGTTGVDMQNGYGWASVTMWGSLSGPLSKAPTGSWTLRRGDIPWGAMSASSILADPIDPANIGYVYNAWGWYRTLDAGAHWTTLTHSLIYTTSINGVGVIYDSSGNYSEDHGNTWKSLGITAKSMIRDDATGLFIVGAGSGGIYVGTPGDWHAYGLTGEYVNVRCLSICSGKIVVVTSTGKVYRSIESVSTIAARY